ncbi:N-acetyltransferase [Mechercharimyces sp. CAU 1602]|uniref:N-acetyltransferase n=1 Tax=Mechercharimyces sp. CAU 1602 TaxID=2973933 RepID=UPI0021626C0B|nr:N-acetyltransferase [Mechercharimyces sp. CAU 1602]MCS1350605.1 N-acetyltransferase [Mechercharimyces sp. CAU 1602]
MQVERLKINYKTLEEFRKFQEYGLQELSMLEDLEANLIENDSDSPFYGIRKGEELVARISLYRINKKYDPFFQPAQDYFELWKLEVLPPYRGQHYGTALVEHAKTLGLPIKTNARRGSDDFWLKMGFTPVNYNPVRDRGENPYVWLPIGVQLRDA